MIRSAVRWWVLPVVLSLLAPLLVVAGAPVAVRAPLVGAFFLVAPGWVAVRPLRLTGWTRFALVPVLSITSLTLVSLVVVYLIGWSVVWAVLLLAGLTLAGTSGVGLSERRRS